MRMEVAEIRKTSAEAGYYKPMALSDRDRLKLRAEIAGMKRNMPRSLTEAEREQMEMDIESEMTNPIQPMTEMEREARAINERNKIKWTEEKRRGMLGQQQMMGAIADAMAIQAPEMPPRAFAQMLSAISDAMAIQAPKSTNDLIQGLPEELQNKIFGFLPKKLKKDVMEGTEEEQEVRRQKNMTDSEILDFIDEEGVADGDWYGAQRDLLYEALLEKEGINISGKSDSYMEEMRDKYHPITDDMLVKWFRKGGLEFANLEARKFRAKYGG